MELSVADGMAAPQSISPNADNPILAVAPGEFEFGAAVVIDIIWKNRMPQNCDGSKINVACLELVSVVPIEIVVPLEEINCCIVPEESGEP